MSTWSREVVELIACTCSWDIPDVAALPPHSHRLTDQYEPGRLIEHGPFAGTRMPRAVVDPEVIDIWVKWRDVARATATGRVS